MSRRCRDRVLAGFVVVWITACPLRRDDIGLDGSRSHAVDAHALGCVVHRRGFRQSHHRVLGRSVRTRVGNAVQPGDGREVDDGPMPRLTIWVSAYFME